MAAETQWKGSLLGDVIELPCRQRQGWPANNRGSKEGMRTPEQRLEGQTDGCFPLEVFLGAGGCVPSLTDRIRVYTPPASNLINANLDGNSAKPRGDVVFTVLLGLKTWALF